MSIDRFGIHIGILYIHFYGVILMTGVVVAAYFSSHRAEKKGEESMHIWDMLTWIVIAGVLGARLWHILTPPPSMVEQGFTTQYYLTHPLDALAIWRGGLGIVGAVTGGLLALFFYTRKYKINFLKWADIIAPTLALAQAIGRFGNFVNQELYGLPTNLPWGIYIDYIYRVSGYENYTHFHPLFAYEAIWNLGTMAVLLWLEKRLSGWLKDGDVILFYMILYPIGRFLLEYLRLNSSEVGGINANQALMVVVALASALVIYLRHKFSTPNPSEPNLEATAD